MRTGPDQTVWWDPATVKAAALAVLRLTESDVDAARIEALVPVAGERINNDLDRCTPVPTPAPATLTDAVAQVVVMLYRRKDAPPSSIDGAMLGNWQPPAVDPVAAVRAQIRPYRERFGVG